MNHLDRLSNFLKPAEYVPIVSTIPAIVHLVCVIRDQIFPKAPFVPPAGETLIQLSKRKLDNWTHLRKGILALIPVIGNAILLGKWALDAIATKVLAQYNCYYRFPNKLKRIPDFLIDGEFLRALPKINFINTYNFIELIDKGNFMFILPSANDRLFSRTSDVNKNNIQLVEHLINHDIISTHSYMEINAAIRNDQQIISAYERQVDRFIRQDRPSSQNPISIAKEGMLQEIIDYYKALPLPLKLNVTIINKLASELGDLTFGLLMNAIPNQNLYKDVPCLLHYALKSGIVSFKDLSANHQTPDAACAALQSVHPYSNQPFGQLTNIFNNFSDTLKENAQVLEAYGQKANEIQSAQARAS